jgi:hypothetical protein
MTYTIDDGVVTLSGASGVEEVEALHASLCGVHEPVFDLAGATQLHTAVVQVILAAGGAVRNAPPDVLFAACHRALSDFRESLS